MLGKILTLGRDISADLLHIWDIPMEVVFVVIQQFTNWCLFVVG